MKMQHFLGLLFSTVFALSGCMLEQDTDESAAVEEEEEGVGEAEAAFSGIASFTSTAVGSQALNSGVVSTDAQAFLASVVGNFTRDSLAPPAEVRSYKSNSTTFAVLAVPASSGATIGATGYAISPGQDSTVAVRECNHSGPGTQSVSLDVPSGNRFCFLNRVANVSGNAFNSWDDEAEIDHSTNPPTLKCHNDSHAWASCIPITSYLGAVYGGSTGTSTVTNLGAVDNVHGKVCGLYSVNGTFRTNSATNGLRTYVSGSDWYFATSTGKGGHVACVY